MYVIFQTNIKIISRYFRSPFRAVQRQNLHHRPYMNDHKRKMVGQIKTFSAKLHQKCATILVMFRPVQASERRRRFVRVAVTTFFKKFINKTTSSRGPFFSLTSPYTIHVCKDLSVKKKYVL